MRPITVYLDSCDFSDLSDPVKDSKEMREVLGQLREWSVSGDVVFLYSYVHIAEVTQTTASAIFHARRRGQLITDLCRGNCFKFPQLILKNELSRLVGLCDTGFSEMAEDNGWLPEKIKIFSRKELESSVKDEVEAILHSSGKEMTRNQRRLVKKKSERFKSYDFDSRELLDNKFSEVRSMYPVRDEFKNMLFRYIKGEISENSMNDAMYQEVADPQWVCEWVQSENQYSTFVRSLREKAQDLFNLLEPAARGFREYVIDQRKREVISKEEFRRSAAKMMDFEDCRVLELLNKVLEKEGVLEPIDSIAAAKLYSPGLYTALKTISSRFRKASLGEQRLLRSDFFDAIHAIHAPYVDIFRADSNAAQNIPVLTGTTVVTNIRQLIDSVEKTLVDRRAV